jgi:hypothetical protein
MKCGLSVLQSDKKKKGACFSYTPFSCCLFYTSVKLCFITQKQRVVVLLLPSINEFVLLSLLFYFIFTLSYFIFTHTYIYTIHLLYFSTANSTILLLSRFFFFFFNRGWWFGHPLWVDRPPFFFYIFFSLTRWLKPPP